MGVKYTEAQLAKTPAGQRNGYVRAAKPPPPKPLFAPEVYPQRTGSFTIEETPMGAPRISRSDKWKSREVVERYHALKDAIRSACTTAQYQLGGVLTIRFEIPMPESWSGKKKAAYVGQPHQTKPDIDNCVKCFMDAFNEDDSHTHTLIASKVWATTGKIIITR